MAKVTGHHVMGYVVSSGGVERLQIDKSLINNQQITHPVPDPNNRITDDNSHQRYHICCVYLALCKH